MTDNSPLASSSRQHPEEAGYTYHCAYCSAPIGPEPKMSLTDKYDRVYCSDACYDKARDHPSREYEARGGDY